MNGISEAIDTTAMEIQLEIVIQITIKHQRAPRDATLHILWELYHVHMTRLMEVVVNKLGTQIRRSKE